MPHGTTKLPADTVRLKARSYVDTTYDGRVVGKVPFIRVFDCGESKLTQFELVEADATKELREMAAWLEATATWADHVNAKREETRRKHREADEKKLAQKAVPLRVPVLDDDDEDDDEDLPF